MAIPLKEMEELLRKYWKPFKGEDMKNNTSWYQFKPMIAVYIDLNPVDVMPYSTWEDLGVDSLDLVELIMMVEEEYDVEFIEREIDDIKTIGGLHVLLMRTLESKREADITHRDTINTRGSKEPSPDHCPHCGRR